jgi:hypothetical protein
MIRAGRNNYLFDRFAERKIVAVGWNGLGDLSLINSVEQLKTLEATTKRGTGYVNGVA